MPSGEDSARNGGSRQSSKVCLCQTGCQTGVLHTNLDRQGNSLFPAETGEAGDSKAESIAAAVMQDYYQQNQARSLENQVTACTDNAGDNQRNSDRGNSRQVVGCFFCELRQEGFNSQT